MARVPIYKNSIVASILSLVGFGFAASGIVIIFAESIVGGIIITLIGLGTMLLADKISDNKKFRAWKRKIETADLACRIKEDVRMAIAVYNSNPCNKSLKYISELNPAAGRHVEEIIHAKKVSKK